jgi:H/ACA ribonucleoprotein complex subunit 4
MSTQELIRIDEEPSEPAYGVEPAKRSAAQLMNYGLIPLDKPRGPTSHEVVSWVRRMLGIEKAGHSGTLDPMVSGLLPIGLGHATKALTLLLMFPKEYIAVMRIHSSVPREKVDSVIKEFTDEIYQRPPQRSSVKREVRTRRIYEMEILEQEGNLLLIRCLCQAGTYIRKLIYDMGELLEVGATMAELRRTKVGSLREEGGFVTLHALNDALFKHKNGDDSMLRTMVKPIEDCISDVKRVIIRDSAVEAVCHGAMLAVPGILALSKGIVPGETVIFLTGKGEFVAIGEAKLKSEEIAEAKKGIAFTTQRVIMEQGTYPRLWKKQEAPVQAERSG